MSIAQLYHDSRNLNGEAYRSKLNEMADALENNAVVDMTIQNQIKNLAPLIRTEDQNLQNKVTHIDRAMAKYVFDAHTAFKIGNESATFKQKLDDVTAAMAALNTARKDGGYIPGNTATLSTRISAAANSKHLSRNGEVLNTALLVASIVTLAACIIATAIFPGSVPINLLATLVGIVSAVATGYLSIKKLQPKGNRRTIFNIKPQVLRDAQSFGGKALKESIAPQRGLFQRA